MLRGRIGLMTITQDPPEIVDKWINYYHDLGVEVIFIGFNGSSEEFKLMPHYPYVKYIDFTTTGYHMFERLKYNKKLFYQIGGLQITFANIILNYIKQLFEDIEYLFYFDCDEYLTINENELHKHYDINDTPIANYLYEYYDPSLPFKHYMMSFNKDNGEFTNEFKMHVDYIKSVTRLWHKDNKNLKIKYYGTFYDILDKKYKNRKSLPIKKYVEDTNIAYIKHYWTLNLEDYIYQLANTNGRLMRLRKDGLYSYFLHDINNDITNEKLIEYRNLIKKYNLQYFPEIEEQHQGLREAYIKANNISEQEIKKLKECYLYLYNND